MDQNPWFQPKPSRLGLTPNGQEVCVTVLILVVLFATVAIVASAVRDPLTAVVTILVITGAKLAVFYPLHLSGRQTNQGVKRRNPEPGHQ